MTLYKKSTSLNKVNCNAAYWWSALRHWQHACKGQRTLPCIQPDKPNFCNKWKVCGLWRDQQRQSSTDRFEACRPPQRERESLCQSLKCRTMSEQCEKSYYLFGGPGIQWRASHNFANKEYSKIIGWDGQICPDTGWRRGSSRTLWRLWGPGIKRSDNGYGDLRSFRQKVSRHGNASKVVTNQASASSLRANAFYSVSVWETKRCNTFSSSWIINY